MHGSDPSSADRRPRSRRRVGDAAARERRANRGAADGAIPRRRAAARHPIPLRRQRQRPEDARSRGGIRAEGASRGSAPAWIPRARLQLAQGDGTDCRGGLSRDRAGRARLRPHLRHGRALRRRPGAVPYAQPGARHAGSGVGVRLSLGGRGDRTRSGFAARRLVRPGPTGRLPVGDDDERAVRRSAGAAVRHRGRARPGCARGGRHDLRRARGIDSAAQALSALLHRRAKPTRTCGTPRRASTRSCAPTTT